MAYTTIRTSNGGAANVRASQSTSSTLVGTIAYGTSVNVVRRNDGWLNILYNNVPRFIADYVVASAPQELGEGLNNTDNNKAMCNGSGVNIRSGASTSYSSVGSLSYKQNVTIYDAFYNQSDTYYWYAINSNCTQWVRGDYLTPTLNGISGDGSSSGGTNTEFVVGHVLRINTNNTNLRKSVGGDRKCYVQAGTKFIIAGSTTSGSYTWAKVYWGGTHATYMYVRNDCCEDLATLPLRRRMLFVNLPPPLQAMAIPMMTSIFPLTKRWADGVSILLASCAKPQMSVQTIIRALTIPSAVKALHSLLREDVSASALAISRMWGIGFITVRGLKRISMSAWLLKPILLPVKLLPLKATLVPQSCLIRTKPLMKFIPI